MSNARYIGEVAPTLGRKNLLINGALFYWQRGSSQTSATQNYGSVDRFSFASSGSTFSVSQQVFTLGQTDVPEARAYYLRNVVTSSAASGNYVQFFQRIEDVRIFNKKTITVSFYAKADASRNIGVCVGNLYGSGGSTADFQSGQVVSLTTSWKRYSVTFTTADITGKTLTTGTGLQVEFWLDAGSTYNSRSGSIGQQSGTFDFACFQVEYGSEATDFEWSSLGEELALCQRYYETGHEPYLYRNTMNTLGISAAYDSVRFQVAKRVNPTVSVGTTWQYFSAGTSTNFTPTLYGRLYDLYFTTPGTSLVNWNGWNGVGSWIADAEL